MITCVSMHVFISVYARVAVSLCVCIPVCVVCWEGGQGRVCIVSYVCELVVGLAMLCGCVCLHVSLYTLV